MGHYAEGDTHGYTREEAAIAEQEYKRQAEAEEMLLQITDVLKAHNRYHMKAPDHEQAVKAIRDIVTPKGKWIDYQDEGFVECPFCGSATNCDGDKDELHYCWFCGANMRGEEK